MNILDRAISFVAPRAGLNRLRAREAIRLYEGAAVGRRASSWKALHTSANAELQYAIRPLRDRARDLARNTPHANRALDILCSHTIGNGLIPVSSSGSDRVDRRVKQLWDDWCGVADVTGKLTFGAMQVLATRSMIESGEVVLRFIDRELDDKLPVPMQMQLLEADYIDQFRDGIYGDSFDVRARGVQKSRLGVGLGPFDKFMGLWLWPWHPGEINTINLKPLMSEFIPADELLHVFRVLRPGQVRGVPWFAPILMTARDLSDFMDAVNVKARVEACFAGFITNGEDSQPVLDPTAAGLDQSITDASNPNAMVTTLEPGMLKELRTGQEISFAQPTTNTQIDSVLMFNLQAMASGLGVTYDQITGDLRQANYSSLRAGKLDFWRLVGQLQTLTVIPQFCDPVWRQFISRATLAGRLPARAGGYPCDWVVPAREAVDPKKDLDAEKNEVRAGRVTPQAFIASRGGDYRTTLEDFESFFKMAHDKGITLDIDVARVDQHGRQPPKKGAGTDQADAEDAADDIHEEREDSRFAPVE